MVKSLVRQPSTTHRFSFHNKNVSAFVASHYNCGTFISALLAGSPCMTMQLAAQVCEGPAHHSEGGGSVLGLRWQQRARRGGCSWQGDDHNEGLEQTCGSGGCRRRRQEDGRGC